jgi:hypothetical protein
MAFTKLDSGITDSTIWQAPDPIRLVWITMLAMKDWHGYVGASIPGLASRVRVSLEDCLAALEMFKSPDPYSRTQDHEGRRIADADGGWVLLNNDKYRAVQSEEDKRERSRLAMQRLRESRKATVNNVDKALTKLPHTDTDIDADKEEEQEIAPKGARAVAPSALPPPALAGDSNVNEIPTKAIVELALAWELPDAWGVDAESLGWKRASILKESERFRQYWTVGTGKGKRKSVRGWRQSWSNWLSKAEKMA